MPRKSKPVQPHSGGFLNVPITTCRPVQMTCTTQELTSLRWFYDSLTIANFLFLDTSVTFPLTIHNEDGVVVEIVNVVPNSANTDTFNATSVLTTTTSALVMLNVNSIACGTRGTRSQTLDLTMLNIQGTSLFPFLQWEAINLLL